MSDTPSKIKVPFDLSTIKGKLANRDLGKKEEQPVDRDKARRIAALKAKAKEAEQSKEELAAKVAELEAKLEETTAGKSDLEKQIEALKPGADNWKKYEHTEREKLIARLPAEYKGEAKDMGINHLRLLVKSVVPDSSKSNGASDKGGQKDWAQILQSPDADKAIADDQAGFNQYMDSLK